MRQTLYLHIGYHKTGTTSVQSYCEDHWEELRAAGLYYPLTERGDGLPAHHKHRSLIHPLLNMRASGDWNDSRVREVFQPFTDEIEASGCPVALLSAEGFSYFGSAEIQSLAFLKERFDFRIVAFLRSQEQYLDAMYAQRVRDNAETRPFAAFLRDDWSHIDYHAAMSRWAAVCGAENLLVRSYNRLAANGPETLIPTFLSLLGVDTAALPTDDRRWHRTFPAVCTEVLRHLRLAGATDADIAAFEHKCITDVPWNRLRTTDPLFQRRLLSDAQARDVRVRYAESNRRCADAFHGGIPLFPAVDKGPVQAADGDSEAVFSAQELFLGMSRILLSSRPRPKAQGQSGAGVSR